MGLVTICRETVQLRELLTILSVNNKTPRRQRKDSYDQNEQLFLGGAGGREFEFHRPDDSSSNVWRLFICSNDTQRAQIHPLRARPGEPSQSWLAAAQFLQHGRGFCPLSPFGARQVMIKGRFP